MSGTISHPYSIVTAIDQAARYARPYGAVTLELVLASPSWLKNRGFRIYFFTSANAYEALRIFYLNKTLSGIIIHI